jgi:hypothetical protein
MYNVPKRCHELVPYSLRNPTSDAQTKREFDRRGLLCLSAVETQGLPSLSARCWCIIKPILTREFSVMDLNLYVGAVADVQRNVYTTRKKADTSRLSNDCSRRKTV